MNGEQINPQDFISFLLDWWYFLVIILVALGLGIKGGFYAFVKVSAKSPIFLMFVIICVYLLVCDLRDLFPDLQQFNAVREAILSLLVLVAVIWVMWIFFMKKPKP